MNGTEFGRCVGSYKVNAIGTWALLGQSIERNESYVRVYVYGAYLGSGGSAGSSYSSFGILGTEIFNGSYRWYPGVYNLLGYIDITVSHNADGTSPAVSLGFWAKSYHIPSQEVWGNIAYNALPRIPRYANFTEHRIESVSEESIKVRWSADAGINLVQYSLNGGGWQNVSGVNNVYTINNLESGTTYTIRTRIRRSDSNFYTESGNISATTKDYVIKYNIEGTYKDVVPYVNINGTYKKAIPYVNIDNKWYKGIS